MTCLNPRLLWQIITCNATILQLGLVDNEPVNVIICLPRKLSIDSACTL